MSRAFILMLDSFGVGAAPDADQYGDVGADTFRHIAEACAQGQADRIGVRQGPLHIPHLLKLGLQQAAAASQGSPVHALPLTPSSNTLRNDYGEIGVLSGCAMEQSFGKDTQSGHWEMAGVPVLFHWGYFQGDPSFPESLLNDFIKEADIPGVLGNKHASGTIIIEEFGEAHQASGKPIVYTSADSVMQIAAHEETFGLNRLYAICEIARRLVDPYNIGRVIARPFLGKPGKYYRTGNRRDYATPPPSETLLDYLQSAGREVIAIGKVSDIFAHRGVTQTIKANGNAALFQALLDAQHEAPDGSLSFVNFVDFDMLYGHRRDLIGYAKALEDFDVSLGHFLHAMRPSDLALITADHGCDPTRPGSDHTRENVPAIFFGVGLKGRELGRLSSFADMGQTIATHLGIAPLPKGESQL